MGSCRSFASAPSSPTACARAKVDCRLDEEDADEPEDDHPRQVADGARHLDRSGGRPGSSRLSWSRVEKRTSDAAVALVESDSDHRRPGDADDPYPSGPAEDARRLLRRPGSSRSSPCRPSPVKHLHRRGRTARRRRPPLAAAADALEAASPSLQGPRPSAARTSRQSE